MRAKILPLDGKYYGTRIEVEHPHGKTQVEVWFMGNHRPSERELAQLSPEEKWEDYCCDSHYESRDGYEIAKRICEALNK